MSQDHLFFGMGDRWETVVSKDMQKGGERVTQAGPQKGGGRKVTGGAGRGELGMAASPHDDEVALSVMILSGMADDTNRMWWIWEKKPSSAPHC